MGHYHFIFFHLGKNFLNTFNCRYNYVTHNYIFYRTIRFHLTDCFIICRTSMKCWRVMYYNSEKLYFDYKSFKKTKHLAKYMQSICGVVV